MRSVGAAVLCWVRSLASAVGSWTTPVSATASEPGFARSATARSLALATCVSLSLLACSGPRPPLNPPRLVMSTETDMAIQLFMQATILLSNYYGYETIKYSEIRARSAGLGFSTLPFMPPETVRATPELRVFFNKYENSPTELARLIDKHGGYKILVKYYIRSGLRASQAICRNYLLNLEERNEYLEFLQKEIGVAAAVSTAVLALVNANATLSKAFLIGRTGIDGAIDAYQDFRFLNIDREAARILVEAAQNKLGEHYLRQVDSATADSNLVAGGYTFSDALNAVSIIEYQCTRSGIRHLLNRSISNSPTNLGIDDVTGAIIFDSNQLAVDVSKLQPTAKKKVEAAAPLAPVSRRSRPAAVTPTDPGPVVVTPTDPAPAAGTPDPNTARIRAFWRSNPKNKKDVEDWVKAEVGSVKMADFLRLPAHADQRKTIIEKLNIP